MIVKELIAELNKYNPELEVVTVIIATTEEETKEGTSIERNYLESVPELKVLYDIGKETSKVSIVADLNKHYII